tara:strand:- start:778 stop:1464 length:687 start_codon:yes stop_codon:yes gene_type:complete
MSHQFPNILPLFSQTYELWDKLLSVNPKLCFDFGANNGGMAQSLAQKCKIVHAFEPVPDMFDKLCDVAYVHRNIVPFRLGVADVRKELKGQSVFNTWSILPAGSRPDTALDYVGKPPFDMKLVTLDEHSEIYGSPDIIKLDVDGYELRVLKGGLKTLSKKPVPIYFEYSYLPTFLGDSIEEMVALIYKLGYQAWSIDGKYVAETKEAMIGHYPQHTSYDVILVHRDQK